MAGAESRHAKTLDHPHHSPGEEPMLKKVSIAAAVAATLMMLAPAFGQGAPGPATSGAPGGGGAPAAGGGGGGGGGGAPGGGGGGGAGLRGGGGGGGGPGMRGGGGGGNRNVIINRNVNRNFHGGGGPVVGRRYHGGTWYGSGRRFWRGQWYAYGVGPCWRLSPIGYVWVCG
jgi:hypothetical protein